MTQELRGSLPTSKTRIRLHEIASILLDRGSIDGVNELNKIINFIFRKNKNKT